MDGSFKDVRACIENIEDTDMQMFFKSTYLFVGQSFELTEKLESDKNRFHNDNYRLRGIRTSTTHFSIFDKNLHEVEDVFVGLFNVSFRNIVNESTLQRTVAIPLAKCYEPWAFGLFKYFEQKGDNFVFPFSRQSAWHYATVNNIFSGLRYPIRSYRYHSINDNAERECLAHKRRLKANGLRRLRSFELVKNYHFDLFDLEEFKTLRMTNGTPFFTQGWMRYLPKLCGRKELLRPL